MLNLANGSTRERIVFKGFYTNVWSHIKEADVLVLTSKYEGLGMVLIEAAARGISLISSNCPVGPDNIVTSQNGFLYKTGDINNLSAIITQIVGKEIVLPSSKNTSKSISKFGYKAFSDRILVK